MINAGTIHDKINILYPNRVIGVSMGETIYVNQWMENITEEQKTEVNNYISTLNITQLEAEELYNQKYKEIDNKTLALKAKGFTYNNLLYSVDTQGFAILQGAMSAASLGQVPAYIYSGKNKFTFSSATDVSTMYLAMVQFIGEVDYAAEVIRNSIDQQDGETAADWIIRLNSFTDTRTI